VAERIDPVPGSGLDSTGFGKVRISLRTWSVSNESLGLNDRLSIEGLTMHAGGSRHSGGDTGDPESIIIRQLRGRKDSLMEQDQTLSPSQTTTKETSQVPTDTAQSQQLSVWVNPERSAGLAGLKEKMLVCRVHNRLR
jgi:hypothetical protein